MDEEQFPPRVIAETEHFRVLGRDVYGWFVVAKHNIRGPAGPALSYGCAFFPELNTMIEEFRAELANLLIQVHQHPDPGTLSRYRSPIRDTPIADRQGLSLRFAILRRDGYRCQICGRSAQHGAVLEVDHRFPRARGGTDDPTNLWTLCFECNRGKSDSDL